MPTLDDFIPEPRLCELDSIEVGATTAEAFAVARDFDLARVPLASALFGLRTLIERMTHGGDVFARPSLRVADIGRVGSGFRVLEDLPDRLIVGAIGRFWESEITFADVPSASFMSYDEAGWGKVAWEVGDVLPATPNGSDGFTVLAIDEPHALVLGGLVDSKHDRGLPIDAAKPEHYFQSTWAFVLEPLAHGDTRLLVRARVDFAPATLRARVSTRALGLAHHFMQREQLANLKRRAEGNMPRVEDSWIDLGKGLLGASSKLANLVTPFLHGMFHRREKSQ